MSPKSGDVDRENKLVLLAVQAFLGLISSGIVAIAVRAEGNVELILWVREHTHDIEQDVAEAVAEMEALFVKENPLITTRIIVGSPDADWFRWAGRMIYWQKDA